MGTLPTFYLGLPPGANNNKKEIWVCGIERIKQRLGSRKNKTLSKAGGLTLIGSVLTNLSIYFMSLFRVPKGVARTIDKLCKDFLLNNLSRTKKVHGLRCDRVGKSKPLGSLGIREAEEVNKALLGKWLWSFSQDPGAL